MRKAGIPILIVIFLLRALENQTIFSGLAQGPGDSHATILDVTPAKGQDFAAAGAKRGIQFQVGSDAPRAGCTID